MDPHRAWHVAHMRALIVFALVSCTQSWLAAHCSHAENYGAVSDKILCDQCSVLAQVFKLRCRWDLA
jgi:cysteinyl-tRNA synthetase